MVNLMILTLCVMGTKYSPGIVCHSSDNTQSSSLPAFPCCGRITTALGLDLPRPWVHGAFALPLQPWNGYLTPPLCVRGKCRSVPTAVRQQEPWHAQESGTVSASLLAGEEEQRWI